MTTSLDMIRGRSNIITMTNNSGGGLVAGDVCIQDTSADENVTTTTSAASVLKVFVAAETIASAAAGKFYASGYCPLVTPSASVTRGRYLFTHTVAKQAAESATYGAGAFGYILKSGTTPSVWLFASTAQAVGAGTIGGSSGSTDNAVIRADGTGGSTVQSSLATVDDSGGINIPTGQTYNINGSPHTHAASGVVNNSAMWFVDEATVTVGNAFAVVFDGQQRYYWWQYQNAAANGDTWTMPFTMAAATYTLRELGMTANSRGIQEVFIDNVSQGTIDWYSAALTYNVVKTLSITVATSGTHVFKSVINGKNGSSSDYQLLLTKIWIQ